MALTKINSSVIANNTIAVGNIADNSVDATKIASNSILTRHIDDDQITTDQIAANTIATANIADNAVDGTKIASNSILTRHIDDNQIGIDQLNVSDGSNGQALTTNGSGTLAFSTISSTPTSIADADSDTKVQVEEGSDEDIIRFDVSGTEYMTLTSNGKLNVTEIAHISGTSGNLEIGNGDEKHIMHSGGYHQFQVADTEIARINGEGIAFNGDSAAANSLDDYEEGTWTPALYTYGGVTTTSSSMYGIYTKIGNICHIHCKIAATLSSLPGQNWVITGLPFSGTNTNDANQRAIFAVGGDCVNTGGNTPKAHFRIAANELHGIYFNASNNTAYWTYNTMDSTAFEMNIHGFYTTT